MKPCLGSDTYNRDRVFDSTVTDGDDKREVMLPMWATPMAEALCKHLDTPIDAAKHVRAGVERVYQVRDIGDGYIHGAGCDFTISKEEEERRNKVKTDNGRIKMVSTAEKHLVPLVLAMYHLVCNRMYGDALESTEHREKRDKAAAMLKEWYTCHAKGAPLSVPSTRQILDISDEFVKEPMNRWESMGWYRNVPRHEQLLHAEEVNARLFPDQQHGTKRSSPASPESDKENVKAAKRGKQEHHVYTAAELSDIHLEGEGTEETPIFDTCDDIERPA